MQTRLRADDLAPERGVLSERISQVTVSHALVRLPRGADRVRRLMRIVQMVAVGDDADIVGAQIAFHLSAGVDFVIAADQGSTDGTTEILESYEREGYLRRVTVEDGRPEGDWRTDLARMAVAEHGAEWVISGDVDEFWWPRGEGLADVFAAIPPRYQIVQALVRVFMPSPDDGRLFADRMSVRTSLALPGIEAPALEWGLRRAYRADPRLVIAGRDDPSQRRLVPVRGWYPIEVLRFPVRSVEQFERRLSRGAQARSSVEAELLEAHRRGEMSRRYDELVAESGRALERGALVEDTRLSEALGSLRQAGTSTSEGQTLPFALPGSGQASLSFRVPDVVDDAAYAVECAALGEADMSELGRHVDELERRIAQLEQGLWPRVVRRLSSLASRSRG